MSSLRETGPPTGIARHPAVQEELRLQLGAAHLTWVWEWRQIVANYHAIGVRIPVATTIVEGGVF